MKEKKKMEEMKSQLSDIGFPCENFDESYFVQAFNTGLMNQNFTFIIHWIGKYMSKVCSLKNTFCSKFNVTDLESELLIFYIDLSSFLQELGCPFKVLMTGSFADRFFDTKHKKLLVSYLCTEFKAAKMNFLRGAIKSLEDSKPKLKDLNISLNNLTKLISELSFSYGENVDGSGNIHKNIKDKLKFLVTSSILEKTNPNFLFADHMTEDQWSSFENIYKEMLQEYEIRRSLMLVRLELTINSFLWKENVRINKEIIKCVEEIKSIDAKPSVKITDILVADENSLLHDNFPERNSNRTIYKKTIGNVPDRGGRPECHQPPPPELPPWQANRTTDQRNRGEALKKRNSNSNFNKSYEQGGNRTTDRYHQPTFNQSFQQDMMNERYFGFSHRIPAGDNFHQYGLNRDHPTTQFRGTGRPYRRY